MNKNNFLKTLSLSILLLPLNVYVSEAESVEVYENKPEITETEATSEPSYWRQYAPQMLQDAGDYAANWVPESVRDRINSWSTKKKLAIASAILASLAAVYNREIIIEFIKNAIKEPIKLEKKLISLLSEKDIADVHDKTEQKCESMKYSNTQDYYISQYRHALNQSHSTHSYLNSINLQKYILEAYLVLKKLDNEWLIKHYPEYR